MKRFLFSATSRIAVILMLLCLASVSFAKNPAQRIDTFDVPNATVTHPTGINSAGQITGYYQDAAGQHGFLRARDGRITTFDVSGSTFTSPQAINGAGQITGNSDHGFLMKRDGSIITFDVPPAEGFVVYGTAVTAINPSGEVCGWVREAHLPLSPPVRARGFLRHVDGTFTAFSPTGSDFAYVYAMNPEGWMVGDFNGLDGPWWPLLAALWDPRDGTVTVLWDLRGAHFRAINPSGQITGWCQSSCAIAIDPDRGLAFLRERDGTITFFKVLNSITPSPVAINPAGQITGSYSDATGLHGFLRERDGTVETFDVLTSTNTYPTSMNNAGDIAGWYSDASGKVRGFVRTH